ncbi:hypothetical protein N0V90_011548 [Kalmusia sp. IMI 367209]|nr:hypothetical protein N0V90_011548 [Kalmusia sp. IMI 367209]
MSSQAKNLAAILPAIATDLVVEERPVPTPGADEVLVRNHFIAVNPIDWKRQAWGFMIPSYPTILGADVSGVIETVGSNVTNFKPGDRVFGCGDSFVTQKADNASFQSYTIVRETSTLKLPANISLEQGATLGTGVFTAYLMLFHVLGLPQPKSTTTAPDSTVLVWGGASIVGNFAIQFARLAGLHVYATASKQNHEYLRSLGASALFDYHSSTIVKDIVTATEKEGKQIAYVVDAISELTTLGPAIDILSKSTAAVRKIVHTLPWPEDLAKPAAIEAEPVHGEDVWKHLTELSAKLLHEDLPKWLESGAVVPTPFRVVEGGVGKLQDALNELKAGVSNQKLLVKV